MSQSVSAGFLRTIFMALCVPNQGSASPGVDEKTGHGNVFTKITACVKLSLEHSRTVTTMRVAGAAGLGLLRRELVLQVRDEPLRRGVAVLPHLAKHGERVRHFLKLCRVCKTLLDTLKMVMEPLTEQPKLSRFLCLLT